MLIKPNWHLVFSNLNVSVITSWRYFFVVHANSEHVKFRMNFYRLGQVISFYLVFPHSDILTFNTVIIVLFVEENIVFPPLTQKLCRF